MSLPRQPDSGAAGVRLAVVVGAALLVAGVWGTFVREVSFGWYSFTPLVADSTPLVSDAPRTVVLDTPGMLFLAALIAGVALVAAAAGYLAARRA